MRSGRVRIAHESRLGVIRAHPNNPFVHTAAGVRPKRPGVSGACGAFIVLVKLGWNRRVRIRCNRRCDPFGVTDPWTPPRHACLLTVRKGFPHHIVGADLCVCPWEPKPSPAVTDQLRLDPAQPLTRDLAGLRRWSEWPPHSNLLVCHRANVL